MYEVQDKIMSWAEIEAGTLADSETVRAAPPEIRQIMTEKQFLAQIREERLANLLSTEISEAEPLWLDYEYEETQVKIDIADMVLQELCFETIKATNNLKTRFEPKDETDEKIDMLFDTPRAEAQIPIILQTEQSSTNIPIKPIVQKPVTPGDL